MNPLSGRFALAALLCAAALVLSAGVACAQGPSELIGTLSSAVVTVISLVGLLLAAGGWLATWRQYGTRITRLEGTLYGTTGRQDEGEVARRQQLTTEFAAHCREHEQLLSRIATEIRAALSELKLELTEHRKD